MTTPRDDLQLRPASADDFDAVSRMVSRAFGENFEEDESGVNGALFEPARNLVFADGDRIVANAGAYTREVTVPGAVVAGAHVTFVGVHPAYRRRGLLTRMMHRQLREVREGGVEPIALLWASEGTIYQRFGYGMAALRLSFTADRREVAFLPRLPAGGGGRLREASLDEARKDMVDVYERVRAERVGWSGRSEEWWNYVLQDKPEHRHGATPRHALLYEGAGGVQGYAIWRSKPKWDHGPAGEVAVRELVATTPEAYAELWRFLFSVDLMRAVDYWCGAPDEPLLHMLNEPRRLEAQLSDSLWVRLADLPAALAARRYTVAIDVTLEVDDALLPENAGRWRLRSAADGGSATCVPADGPADLACDVADLGAAYLGGTPLSTLAATGRVRELRPGTLTATSTAFGWHRQPSATEVF